MRRLWLLLLLLLAFSVPLVESRRHRYGNLNKARMPPPRARNAKMLREQRAEEDLMDEEEDTLEDEATEVFLAQETKDVRHSPAAFTAARHAHFIFFLKCR